jgi:transposase
MTADERIAHLEEQLKQALEQICLLQEQLAAAQKHIEELEKQKTPPPAFVKANVKKPQGEAKKPRKTRNSQHNHGRLRAVPTQIEEHRIVTCPDCHLRLGGLSLARVREVIEVPPPPPVQVIHHRIFKGWCTSCQKWHEAPVALQREALGQGRLGVRLISLIALWHTVMRVPVRQIRALLSTLHGVNVSIGEISEVLHRLVAHAQPALEQLKQTLRASPAVQADETGWREDGTNGYVWSLSTPTLRSYEYHHSRGGAVVKHLLGEDFQGVLGSDFYGGYNIHQGEHQRCWVHFFRDIHDLKKRYPDDGPLGQWATQVKRIYERAKIAAVPDPQEPPAKQHTQRVVLQHAFEQELWQVCAPFVATSTPMQTLCKRVERFLPELFVFVAFPGVPSDNNLAERSVRPLVIARKISGGSRSPKGSATRMGLASLFGTWIAQGLNPFHQCLALLSSKTSLG